MSTEFWHKHYHVDALNGMANLSVELRGVYYTLLDMMYDARGPLACSDQMFAARMCCSVRKWKSYRESLIAMGKIHLTKEGKISNDRFEKELKTSRKRAENGAKGGRARAENSKKAKENNDSDEIGFKQTPKPIELELDVSSMSSSNEESIEGVSAPSDQEFIWSAGLEYLTKNGSTSKAARPMLGRWIKDAGNGVLGQKVVADAIRAAMTAGTGDPIPYISKIIKNPTKQSAIDGDDIAPTTRLVRKEDGQFVLEAA